jgi:DNA-directed RNA polymerase specialized sigma24 family protein
MDHDAVAGLLEQWGLWSRQERSGPVVRIRAGSAEGQHRPEAGQLFADDLHAPQPRIGDDVALRVERAVVGCGNPHRDALTLAYVVGMPVQVIAARLGVADARPVLDAAHAAVARRLRI